jgi:hypothetical protein
MVLPKKTIHREVMRMHLAFGMSVVGTDGIEAGTLERALVDPERWQVTHVVVRPSRVRAAVVLPLSLVQGSTEGHLLLHSTSSALADMPGYEASRTDVPPYHRVVVEDVPETEDQRERLEEALELTGRTLELGPATPVRTVDGVEGQLLGLAAEDATYSLATVFVHGLVERELAIPGYWLAALRADGLLVGQTREWLDRSVGIESGPFVTRRSGPAHHVIERGPVGQPAQPEGRGTGET